MCVCHRSLNRLEKQGVNRFPAWSSLTAQCGLWRNPVSPVAPSHADPSSRPSGRQDQQNPCVVTHTRPRTIETQTVICLPPPILLFGSLTPSGVPVHCAHFPSQLVSPILLARAWTRLAERLAYAKLDLITALQQAVSLPQV